jgi:DHA2 family multidrug resistance protein
MVDLKLLKNRNFGVGCLLIFLFGIAIYSTIVVLPLFYQELLGYTAFAAGVVVAPRGIGAICGMPIIGYLSNKIYPRYLLSFGFIVFGFTTLYFGSIDLSVSPTTLLWPILITGFGLSFVFVPINTAAYGTLRNEQIGGASGIFNLMRNVGGSVGISLAQTLLTRRADVHQNDLTNYVPRTGQQFQGSLGAARGALTGPFGPANTLHPAQALLYEQLGQQARLWAFVDVFRWLSILSFLCLGVAWMFKKVKPGKAPAGAH